MYLLTSKGAQNYEVYNVLLNLLLGAQTFMYQKSLFFQPRKPGILEDEYLHVYFFYRLG